MKRASTVVVLLLAVIATFSPQGLAAEQENVATSPGTASEAGSATEQKEWSLETLKEDVLHFARNAVCDGSPTPKDPSATSIPESLPQCEKGCRFRRVQGMLVFPGSCKGVPGSQKVYPCTAAKQGTISGDDGASPTPPEAATKDGEANPVLEAIEKVKDVFKEKLAEVVEWSGLCEGEGAEEDGYETKDGDFSAVYATAESSSYVDYYGEEPPAEEDTAETAAEL